MRGRVPGLGARGAMTQLRLLVVASLLVPLLALGALGWTTWREEQARTRRAVAQTLDLVQEHALKTFETIALAAGQADEALRGLGDEEIRAHEEDIHPRLQRLAQRLPQVQDVWLLDARGGPLVSATMFPVLATINAADRDYFKVHQQPGAGVFISRLLRGRASDVRFFQFSTRRADPDGTFRGVTAVSVEPNYFQEFQRRVGEAAGLTLSLVRETGEVLVRHPTRARELFDHPVTLDGFDAMRRASPEQGLVKTASMFEGGQRLFGYRHLPGFPVYVTAAADASTIWQNWLGEMTAYLAMGIPATVGLFLLSLLALHNTRRESEALAALRAEAEKRESAEAALRQVQKTEAVGRLTGGIAHDFNNLLTVVLGNLDMLLHRLDPSDIRSRRSATLAKEGAIRAALLTQRLLAFSRQQPLAPRRVDANALVAGMSDLTRRTLGEKIQVRTVLPPARLMVDIDVNQLESAILNLSVNARDAMPEGGALTLETAGERVSRPSDDPEAPPPGDYVVIRVRDTGTGIPPDVLPKVFEPFFTTKPHGQGTGLGLSQVYGFIKQSGGYVLVESEAGRGTTFSLWLPAAGQDAAAAPVAPAAPPPAGEVKAGSQRVALVVEDDANVRRFSVEALRELGFQVIEAADAAGAMDQLARHETVDLLFSDVGLPGTDGRSLARMIRGQRPSIRVLLTSGYANQIAQFRSEDGFELLPKPFSIEQLAERVTATFAA